METLITVGIANWASLVAQMVKNKESACNVEDEGSNPGSRRSSGEGNGYVLQYSCLEKSVDRRAQRATVQAVTIVKKIVKVAQLCPTLCNPMDYTVHGILQARILKGVEIIQMSYQLMSG